MPSESSETQKLLLPQICISSAVGRDSSSSHGALVVELSRGACDANNRDDPNPSPATTAAPSPQHNPKLLPNPNRTKNIKMAPSKSVPIPIHRSASHTPSMMVNAKKYLSDRPQLLDCPRCRCHGETELRFVNGFCTYLTFLIILVCGVAILPLFFLWIPFCVDTFKDVEHHCAGCKAWIGTYRRIGKST